MIKISIQETDRPADILKRLKPMITPHYLRHNFVTMLYEAVVDPLAAMKIVGHTNYQTTANIYTHLNDECLRKAGMDMEKVFSKRAVEDAAKATTKANRDPRSRKPEVDESLPWAHAFGN